MIEHRHPTPATQKNVLAASGNHCAFPSCDRLIFDLEHETLLGTVSHICARSENGPRFDRQQTEEENRSFSNLMALCAEHSKIVDGPRWPDFTGGALRSWKSAHEERVAGAMGRGWIRPPTQVISLGVDGGHFRGAVWTDHRGAPRLFTSHQLAVINALSSLNMLLQKLGTLPAGLQGARDSTVSNVIQQSWAQFPSDQSVTADLFTLMAMTAEVSFAEFLAFAVQGNDPTPLIQEAASRLARVGRGEVDSLVTLWYRSDELE